jgi:proteasome lid subunit RPN8/RPN11
LGSEPGVRIPRAIWARLVLRLRAQSNGRRESGAFLLGRIGSRRPRAVRFVCYDALDPDAYQDGAISFHACGHVALSELCKLDQLEVLADVHTHPGGSVLQSGTDRQNPMVPVVGHTALIIPLFAQSPWWSLGDTGVYEYLGNFRWRTHDQQSHVALTWW